MKYFMTDLFMISGFMINLLRHDLGLLLDILVIAIVINLLARLHEVVVLVSVLHGGQEALEHAQDLSDDVGLL